MIEHHPYEPEPIHPRLFKDKHDFDDLELYHQYNKKCSIVLDTHHRKKKPSIVLDTHII